MQIEFRADREEHLKKLCAEMGRTVDDFAGEAILTFMEDYEDGRDAEAVLALDEPTYSSEEMRKYLGLDDTLHDIGSEATQSVGQANSATSG